MRKKSMMIGEEETAGGHNKLSSNDNKNFHEHMNLSEQKLKKQVLGNS